jgi:IS1 family transposase
MSERSIYLWGHADKCHWHASQICDHQTQVELRKLATEYIERAAEIDNSEPPDVLQFNRTTESLEQENEWLRGRLAQIRRATS